MGNEQRGAEAKVLLVPWTCSRAGGLGWKHLGADSKERQALAFAAPQESSACCRCPSVNLQGQLQGLGWDPMMAQPPVASLTLLGKERGHF